QGQHPGRTGQTAAGQAQPAGAAVAARGFAPAPGASVLSHLLRSPPMTEAWHDRDLQNPHQVEDKAQRVRAMFSAIAPSYDLNNRLHSLWRDQAWRRAAVKFAQLQPGNRVLDVACGTGDLAMAFCHALQPADRARVLGVDFTFDMLTIAQQKRGGLPVEYQQGDAMRLPVSDGSVDVVSIAFGIRNVADPARAIREFHRVLRPGGRVIILEFSLPTSRLMRSLYMFYFN